MTSGMKRLNLVFFACFATVCQFPPALAFGTQNSDDEMRFAQIKANTKEMRSEIADSGMSIEFIRSDSVWGFATRKNLLELQNHGFQVLTDLDFSVARGGHASTLDFPPDDSRFHNYDETLAELRKLESQSPNLVKVRSIGKSVEGRDLWALHINSTPEALQTGQSNKPGVVFMGNHHAREHLSLEIPLMLAQHLLAHREDSDIAPLLSGRDIWIIPMINPDGAEWDVSTGSYKMWRKNRRDNGDGTFGVDLNRNYGFQWGTGGSSSDPRSDVYKGTSAFSEPETQAVRVFISSHLNAKILLSFHTFSELILYPWGHQYDSIANQRDLAVFEKMAATMAQWNHYTPEQSSDLYIASGDTTDWAYGEHGIFAFTFELSPRNIFQGGFYPGASIIDRVFQDNLRPCLYLIDAANNPYKVLERQPDQFLTNLAEPLALSETTSEWEWFSNHTSRTIGTTTGFFPIF